MPQTPEIQNTQSTQFPEVREIPTSPEIPPETVAAANISITPQNFTAQVHDDRGNPLISTPQTQTVAVQIPAINQSQLDVMSQGSQDEAGTWWAAFWNRLILKSKWFRWAFFFSKNP